MIRVRCPNCGKVLKAEDKNLGKRSDCPSCGTILLASENSPARRSQQIQDSDPPTFPVVDARTSEPNSPPPAVSSDPSTQQSLCPHCERVLDIDSSVVGILVACPFCHGQFQVGQTAASQNSNADLLPTIRTTGDTAIRSSGVRSRSRKQQGDDSTKLILGLIGSAVLVFAVFAPFLRAPFFGEIDYFRNGEGDGVIVLVLGVVSFVFVICRIYPALWFTAFASLGVIGFTFVNYQMKIAEMKQRMAAELAGNPFAPLGEAVVNSISLRWGFPLLIIGAGMLIASAAIRRDTG